MEKMRLSQKSAGAYVTKALIFIGYPDNIRVITKFRQDGCIFYDAIYQVFHNGKMVDVLMPLSDYNYQKMLKYGLELSGYDIVFLNQRMKNETITYTLGYKISTYNALKKKK